jgi:hypothetical protein
LGIDIILREDLTIKAIHFYSGISDDTAQFIGELPFNVTFSFSQQETRKLLGNPQASGGGGKSVISGTIPFWDRYVFGYWVLHFQFTNSLDSIELITIYSNKEEY